MTRFTKTYIENLPFTDKNGKQQIYWDAGLSGFGLVVGSQSKTFIVQHDVQGKTKRKKVGRYSQALTLDKARKKAKDWLGDLELGVIPWEVEAAKAAQAITLKQAFDEFIEDKISKTPRSPKTISNYRQSIAYLSKWYKKDLSSITKTMVRSRHTQIGTDHGKYQSNLTFRTFRAVYNHASVNGDRDLPANPATGLSWYEPHDDDEKRSQPLPEHVMPVFWRLLDEKIKNPMRRDYYRLVLFTGLRRSSAFSIEKSHIDLEKKTLHIPKPKGGRKRAFTMPLSDYLCDLIKPWMEANDSPWLFPSNSKSGHMAVSDEVGFVKALEEETGFHFTIHGLRHTFITEAVHLNIGHYQIKLLVNHSIPKSDITGNYAKKINSEFLREPMQRITNRLLDLVEPQPEKKVVGIRR